MPLARNNSIGVTLYGGAMFMGKWKNETISIAKNYEAVGAYSGTSHFERHFLNQIAGKLSKDDLTHIERCSCPTLGACPGMFTANTMATCNFCNFLLNLKGIEAMGMSVPYSSSHLATDSSNNISPAKKQDIINSTKALFGLLKRGIR